MLLEIFKDRIKKFGFSENSPKIIKRLEDNYNLNIISKGFPDKIIDNEEQG